MSESGEDSDSKSGSTVRPVGISVSRDTGTKVDIILRTGGLRKRHSIFLALANAFKKPSHPSKLCENAVINEFNLTQFSLKFSIDVRTESKKKRKGNANRVETYTCHIRRFPSRVNPDSVSFEVLEPASGNCFILMTVMKVDGFDVNWKEFQDRNGTIDASTV
ncbi:hypothetical protein AB6A40_010435 [Gnathostoma spinigerum]|uniref:Uncharacterized protein n=1 Tax=Gnathostoma spinigerum TaxID=75299 RepID=A0ABD6F150_9BILA